MSSTRPAEAYAHLLMPGRVAGLDIPNRIVAAPMERNYHNADGTVSDRTIAHYEDIASGGVGWIDLEATFIEQRGRGGPYQLGIYDDRCIAGLSRLADLAHGHGAVIGVEIHHAGRNTNPSITGEQALAASPVMGPASGGVMPREMSHEEIGEVVMSFGAAATRAEQAGFDIVEVHSAHGYLPLNFLSPVFNRRHDEYGGDLDGRLRFLRETMTAVRHAVADRVVVGMRISIDEFVPGGLQVEETAVAIQRLEADGVIDYVHLSAGVYESGYTVGPSMDRPHGFLLDMVAPIRSAVKLPIVLVNRMSFELAESAIADGRIDFAAFGRQFLADPAFPRKLAADARETVVTCIGCNQGCLDQRTLNFDVTCILNPRAGRERRFARTSANVVRRVVVVGGGPAGMEAARVAAERGHAVVLLEQSDQLGGQVRLAAAPPYRDGWATFLAEAPDRLARAGVSVRLGVSGDAAAIASEAPDDVVFATGAEMVMPLMDPHTESRSVDGLTYLRRADAQAGRVVVLGANMIGLAVAERCLEDDIEVILVDPQTDLSPESLMPSTFLMRALDRVATNRNVTVHAGCELLEASEDGVVLKRAGAIAGLFPVHVPAVDRIVHTTVRVPRRPIVHVPLQPEVRQHFVGDCRIPRSVGEAVLEGANCAAGI